MRAVIWDFDGTLVDTLGVVVAATNRTLQEHDHAQLPPDAIIAGMVLPTTPRMATHAGITDPAHARRLAMEFYRHAQLLGPGLARAYPGVRDVVQDLHARGLVQAVVSNNQGVLVRQLIAQVGLDRWFAPIWGEEDVPAPKPDPRGIRAAAASMGCALSDCIYIGDGRTDVAAAHGAPMPILGATWGIHSRAEMMPMGFEALLDEPREIGEWMASRLSAHNPRPSCG